MIVERECRLESQLILQTGGMRRPSRTLASRSGFNFCGQMFVMLAENMFNKKAFILILSFYKIIFYKIIFYKINFYLFYTILYKNIRMKYIFAF